MTEEIYAVGDIHGQLDALERALDLIAQDGGSEARVVFLGDYTDRGPDSRGVLDRLIEGQAQGRDWVFLKGNHDRMFEWFMQDYPRHDIHLPVELYWLHQRLGGDTTLASYGIEFTGSTRGSDVHQQARENVPQAHIDFLTALPLTYQTDDLFFAHAGIRPGVPLDQQTEHDLLWIRQEFHQSTRAHPKLIVHGHTPVDHARHYGNRVNLDSGAGYGKPLSTAVFQKTSAWLLTDSGRQPIAPDPRG